MHDRSSHFQPQPRPRLVSRRALLAGGAGVLAAAGLTTSILTQDASARRVRNRRRNRNHNRSQENSISIPGEPGQPGEDGDD